MPRIDRDREQRTGLPLEDVPPALTLLPDLGGATTLDDKRDLLIQMPLHVERTSGRDLDHIAAPKTLGAIKLDVGAAATQPLPGRHRQILHAPHADAAIDRHALRLDEAVIRHQRSLESSKAGVLSGLGLVPVNLVRGIVHRRLLRTGGWKISEPARIPLRWLPHFMDVDRSG